MLENLQKDDFIDIKQLDSGNGSYLRSSDWNLVRLEGHVMENSGLNCMIISNKIRCNEEQDDRDSIKITETGLYEVSLGGMTLQVSTDFSLIKHERKITIAHEPFLIIFQLICSCFICCRSLETLEK